LEASQEKMKAWMDVNQEEMEAIQGKTESNQQKMDTVQAGGRPGKDGGCNKLHSV
jgi:hypothetical protein